MGIIGRRPGIRRELTSQNDRAKGTPVHQRDPVSSIHIYILKIKAMMIMEIMMITRKIRIIAVTIRVMITMRKMLNMKQTNSVT